MARLAAAEAALRNFIQLKNGSVPIKAAVSQNVDFTSDELIEGTGNGMQIKFRSLFLPLWLAFYTGCLIESSRPLLCLDV